ncbi:hypothetical protein JRO89_XS08G0027600 [Xanthoceras sorbifolium]|uniref:CCHC-type domain-containing protein n=1 Tax=Xanthoceras sorbifolium TaxID=99658 RepID=A0ABQ8HNF5_9ROSI|nr:hypothetical protein JRO89_XS08G0027600 [Xanthoceras sorbifolium]
MDVYNQEKEKLYKYFEKFSCRFSLTIDEVEFEDNYTCLRVHFTDDDWNLEERIIGLKHIEDNKNFKKYLKNVLLEWGIHNNISSVKIPNDGSLYMKSLVLAKYEVLSDNHDSYGTKERATDRVSMICPYLLLAFDCVIWYECKKSLGLMANSRVDGKISNDRERGVDAIWAAIASSYVREKIRLQRVENVEEALHLALKAEMMEKFPWKLDYARKFTPESSSDGKRQTVAPTNKDFSKNPNLYARAAPLKCYWCGKSGHKSNDCPSRKPVNLAVHILLGRPWQYDVDITYRGRNNICKFHWGDHKIAILPSTGYKEQPKAFKEEGRSFLTLACSEGEFYADAKDAQEVHVIVVKALVVDGGKALAALEKLDDLVDCEDFEFDVVREAYMCTKDWLRSAPDE